MDHRVENALSLMRDVLSLLDECQEYGAAKHLQWAIDARIECPAVTPET